MSKSKQPGTVGSHVARTLRNRARRLYPALKEPETLYIHREIGDACTRSDWQWLVDNSILEDHGRAGLHPEYDGGIKVYNTTRVYSTPQGVWDVLESAYTTNDAHPCSNHGGVYNIPGGEYTCSRDGCERTFDRETAKAILQSDHD